MRLYHQPRRVDPGGCSFKTLELFAHFRFCAAPAKRHAPDHEKIVGHCDAAAFTLVPFVV